MQAALKSIRFIAQCQFERGHQETGRDIELSVRGKPVEALVFDPRNRLRPGKVRKTIMAIHGMSLHGHRDERMLTVCRALAGCGYIVVNPAFGDIKRLKITPRTIDRIADVIAAVSADPALCPSGTLSLFSPSFSAGMCLRAAAYPEIAERIRSICTIGTFGDVDSTIRHLLERQDNDEYGRFIILKNFLHYSIGRRRSLERALEIALHDNGLKRAQPELPLALERLAPAEQELFNKLKNEPHYRLYHWRRVTDRATVRQAISRLSLDSAGNLRAKVSLIHGEGDTVIPPTESVRLHERFKRMNVPSKLVLTPLISHGDSRLRLGLLPAVFRLMSGFSYFFKHS
ncbi:MAG TPA: alpha/beta hydrolase [Spirochaetota bacterium]|nr:alpha/beta hydrolase [Spirochaetota bacterium]HNT11103.1 alpha/beta hydrolase [Spirochaetota bacterium]